MATAKTVIPIFLALLHIGPFDGVRRAHAVIIRHDADLDQTIKLAGSFSAVGQVVPDGTCTLIRPTWVLTAGHVARGLSPFSPAVRFGKETYQIRRVVLHPNSRGRGPRGPGRVDLALLELDRPVEGIKPMELHRKAGTVGAECVIVGYGDFGNAGAKLMLSDGRRRAATNVIDRFESNRIVVSFTKPPDGTLLEGVGGPGDSGGPLLVKGERGFLVAGVSSASMGGAPGQYGVRDVYTRVSTLTRWIDKTIERPGGTVLQKQSIVSIEKDGFPSTVQGRCAEEFFGPFNSASKDRLLRFAQEFRARDLQQRRPNQRWVQQVLTGMRKRVGKIRPDRLVVRDDGGISVLAHASPSGRWYEIRFLFQRRPPHGLDGVGLRPAAAPAENEGKQ